MMNSALDDMMEHEAYADVQETLLFLLEECSLDEAPSIDEVVKWQAVFRQRGGKFQKLAHLCEQFIQENQ